MKKFTPAVIDAIQEAVVSVYWFKSGFKRFVASCGVPAELISTWDQSDSKRVWFGQITDWADQRPHVATPIFQSMIDALVEQDDFPHLKRCQDSELRLAEAKQSVEFLRGLIGARSLNERAAEAKAAKRREAEEYQKEIQRRTDALASMQLEFEELSTLASPQERGRKFNDFLRKLFDHVDLEPRGSFVTLGEEIDGSLLLDSTHFLVEAKWEKGPTEAGEILKLKGKVEEKLDNALGLFISMSGYTEGAIGKASSGRRLLLLMDGQELALAISGMTDLVNVLRRKKREASDTGNVYFRVTNP